VQEIEFYSPTAPALLFMIFLTVSSNAGGEINPLTTRSMAGPLRRDGGHPRRRRTMPQQPRTTVKPQIAAENLEYIEEIGEAVIAPIDIAELVASVAKLAAD
jgi:hypothetical protein